MEKLYFDGEDSLDSIVQWVAEPHDIKERVERLRTACSKSLGFSIFISETFKPTLTFKELFDNGLPFVVRPLPLGRWGQIPFERLMKELPKFSDKSTILPIYRRTQLLNSLDETLAPDAKLIEGLVRGQSVLTDKINTQVVQLAFPDIHLGEVNGQSPKAESP